MPKVHKRTSQGRSSGVVNCVRCTSPIVKGEEYYEWAIKQQRGGIIRRQHASHGYPRPSQLTMSVLSGLYSAQESSQDAIASSLCPSDCRDALEELKSEIESIIEEFQGSLDNMPEGLQQGDTGQLIQERIDALEEYGQELDNAVGEIEDPELDDGDEESDESQQAAEDGLQAAQDRANEAVDSLSL